MLGVEVTAGNVSDSVAWDAVYDQVTNSFPEVKFVTMDAGYKTPWIAKKVLEHSRIPILPYTRYKGKKDKFKPWDFTYDAATDSFTCPRGHELRHTTTSKEGKRTYRSSPKICKDCPCRTVCGANEKRTADTHNSYLAGISRFGRTFEKNRTWQGTLCHGKETIERVLLMQKKSTPCGIRTTEVWPGFLLG
ncbi:MAG: transposase [Flavonifractor plautii]